MKIIIDIPENLYEWICKYPEHNGEVIYKAVAEGTVLDKGCGNLLNENRLVSQLIYGNVLKDDVKCGELTKILDNALVVKVDRSDTNEDDN